MSNFIYAYVRDGDPRQLVALKRRIEIGASRLEPAKSVRPLQLLSNGRLLGAVLNPAATVKVSASAVCLGQVSSGSKWREVGATGFDGTYAICRADETSIEMLSDVVASRTLWYYFDDNVFVASTSQRWIVTALGAFVPNPSSTAWMLATGSLGPVAGWDARLVRLQADCVLTLDLRAWRASVRQRDVVFKVSRDATRDVEGWFRSVLVESVRDLNFDYDRWVLTLSGGYDSRAILCLLGDRKGLRTVTWGSEDSKNVPGSDAAIAAELAELLGVEHEYFIADKAEVSLRTVFERFVRYGEGRINHITAYLDGFAIWQALLDRGMEGIIRGDEGFGWRDVQTLDEARRAVGLHLWSDFRNLPDTDYFELEPQVIPEFLSPRTKESVCQYRDRLYHQYRLPTVLAALTDLKTPFVEIANPFLSRSIIEAVRQLPDNERTDKALFKRIVKRLAPNVQHGTTISDPDRKALFRSPEALRIFAETLASDQAEKRFSERLIAYVQHNLREDSKHLPLRQRSLLWRQLRNLGPRQLKRGRRKDKHLPTMDVNTMAFRMYIICQIHTVLEQDAATGASRSS